MKWLYRYFTLMLALVMCIFIVSSDGFMVNAYNSEEHNEIMRQVLFHNWKQELENAKFAKRDIHNKEVIALENACYL